MTPLAFTLMGNYLFLGTSSWTADGWEKSFYPPKMKKAD
jgi:uncharacterized protein YecE (DUF72 family)